MKENVINLIKGLFLASVFFIIGCNGQSEANAACETAYQPALPSSCPSNCDTAGEEGVWDERCFADTVQGEAAHCRVKYLSRKCISINGAQCTTVINNQTVFAYSNSNFQILETAWGACPTPVPNPQ